MEIEGSRLTAQAGTSKSAIAETEDVPKAEKRDRVASFMRDGLIFFDQVRCIDLCGHAKYFLQVTGGL